MTDTTERAREFLLESVNDPTEAFADLVHQGAYDTTAEFRMAKRVLDALSASQPTGEDAEWLRNYAESVSDGSVMGAREAKRLREIAERIATIPAMPQPTSTVEAGDALREAREALEKIAGGSRLGIGMFERRVKEHDCRLTWYAVNVLQDNLAACEGTAHAALAKLDTAEKGDGE